MKKQRSKNQNRMRISLVLLFGIRVALLIEVGFCKTKKKLRQLEEEDEETKKTIALPTQQWWIWEVAVVSRCWSSSLLWMITGLRGLMDGWEASRKMTTTSFTICNEQLWGMDCAVHQLDNDILYAT